MGQSLSEPKTDKETLEYGNSVYMVAVSGMQGWRPEMEDSWSVQLPLVPVDPNSAYFAVFDGHGSSHFSTHCGNHLHQVIVNNPSFCERDYELALKTSFHCLDLDMRGNAGDDEGSHLEPAGSHLEPGGTTAVVVLIKDNCIFCANAGDSRAIASQNGRVVELSHDHKPNLPVEESRIRKAGGWVEFNRVNGNLALSRALGDFNFKRNNELSPEEQIVTADPDITRFLLSPDFEFVILACDGVWDVMTNEEVLEFVRSRLAQKMKPTQICECLLDHCLAPDCRMGGVGCDNMTVILACFLHGDTYSHLAERCGGVSPNNPTETSSQTIFQPHVESSNCSREPASALSLSSNTIHQQQQQESDPLDFRGRGLTQGEMKGESDTSQCQHKHNPQQISFL